MTYLFSLIFLAALGIEGTATAIAGFIAPVVTHVTKKFFGVDSTWAYLLHLGASAVVTILSLAINQQLSVGSFADRFTTVAFLSQTLFHLFKSRSGLTVEAEPILEEKEEEKPQ